MSDTKTIDTQEDICEVEFVDSARVETVRAQIPDSQVLGALSDIFKALSDPSRLSIVSALAVSELCVCDIANLLGSSISAVSHQLRVLRNMKLVKNRKKGKMVYYSLDDECVETLLKEGIKHIHE
jgi:DNA-binding transcriptional ArsR family regulator